MLLKADHGTCRTNILPWPYRPCWGNRGQPRPRWWKVSVKNCIFDSNSWQELNHALNWNILFAWVGFAKYQTILFDTICPPNWRFRSLQIDGFFLQENCHALCKNWNLVKLGLNPRKHSLNVILSISDNFLGSKIRQFQELTVFYSNFLK